MTRAVGGGAVRVGNDIRMDALALVQAVVTGSSSPPACGL